MKNFTALAVLLWFLCALAAGWFDLFSQSDTPPIYLGLFFALPIVVFTTLYLSNADFRALAKSIDLSLIVGAHVWRYVGIGFLIAFLFGRLPAQFAIPEGLGDIIAAVFALPLALALRRGKPVRGYFIAWNVFGFADLFSAITMRTLFARPIRDTPHRGLNSVHDDLPGQSHPDIFCAALYHAARARSGAA